MSLEEAFAPIEAVYREEVLQDTWGHLYPEVGREYKGYILFTHSDYGDMVIIRSRFDGLQDSPWFFDDQYEFVTKKIIHRGKVYLKEGGIYRFEGTYKKFKSGNYRFSGEIREIKVP